MNRNFGVPSGTLIPFPNHFPGPVVPAPLPRAAVPAAAVSRFSLGGVVAATGTGILIGLMLATAIHGGL